MITDFAMYTEEGNRGVAKLAQEAKKQKWTWAKTYAKLESLSKKKSGIYEEAMDTAVREVVYDFIGAGNRGESFYI